MDKTINAIKDAVAPLAQKIGEGASHVYVVYTRQQFTVGIMELIWAGGLIIASLILAKLATESYIKARDYKSTSIWDTTQEGWWCACVFLMIGSAIAALVFVGFTADGIQHLLNPEYYALQDILATVKGQ